MLWYRCGGQSTILGVCSLPPLLGISGLNSDSQTCLQAPLPASPSTAPPLSSCMLSKAFCSHCYCILWRHPVNCVFTLSCSTFKFAHLLNQLALSFSWDDISRHLFPTGGKYWFHFLLNMATVTLQAAWTSSMDLGTLNTVALSEKPLTLWDRKSGNTISSGRCRADIG